MRAERERAIDYEETARLATEAFASSNIVLAADRMRWFYERCFLPGTIVVALRSGERKIGQIALLRQEIVVDGVRETAAQLVDLFVSAEYRGRDALTTLYGEVERQFLEHDIRFAIAMPNASALPVNEHFLQLKPFLRLPFSMGVALPLPAGREPISYRFDPRDRGRSLDLLADYRTLSSENGLAWDEQKLVERISGFGNAYGVHATDELLLISSPRQARGVDYTLLCGFLARPGTEVTRRSMRRLVTAGCRMWGRRLFAYAGVNRRLPALPGMVLPGNVRPSPLVVQLRDFKPDRAPLKLDRYQLLDFDFA